MVLLVVFFVDRFTAISEKTIKIMLIPFQEKDKKSSEQKELKLSAFDEFMEELDLDDF